MCNLINVHTQKTYQIDYSLQRLMKPFLKYCLASYIRTKLERKSNEVMKK